ncbi:hypothetical protein DICPUDRAFT_79452 [Dictyostelium purpureum]|uniref:UBX domain-containing protein n=1 Tax=Dictyostelium purpureum TaxID=5786 RepID=F0ZMM2_DICPU|nr:uncharacterized protein DICPUDRAFT_79452 [Dictyostelium purpureum]EGC34800.1 hypothetical protein DICPUDRAFT_79452 [Dictyostelium purpureum]|eukprot:XP_003288657.1 hypothetical protein DICPUDRAFT_79452 [Dictyostelium purpureum]
MARTAKNTDDDNNTNNNGSIEDEDLNNNKSPTATPDNEPFIPNYDYINKAKMTTIIFKTPTGSPLKGEFAVTDKLKHVRDYFIANYPIDKSFHMMTVYPKHYFTNNDYNKTLLDLELVPSATIIIGLTEDRDSKNNTNSNSNSSSTSSDYGLYSYFSSVKDYVSSFFAYTPQQTDTNTERNHDREDDSVNSNNNYSNNRGPIKKRTGVHSLNDSNSNDKKNDDNNKKDDSNSYYNGNSTQFNG